MTTHKNWLEWCVFAVGLVLVCGTLGYLVYDAFTQEPLPPLLQVTLAEPYQHLGHYVVPVTVHNHGGGTAQQVLIRVTLRVDGEEEAAEFELPHVPRQSDRHGFVTFDRDPAQGELSGRAVGYERP